MKKTILALSILISFNAFSQDATIITEKPSYEIIGEVKWGPMFVADLTKYSDDSYVISYQDAKFKAIENIKEFSMSESAKETVLSVMKNQLLGGESTTVELGDKMLMISTFKKKKSIMITIVDEYNISSFFTLRAKDINKLFTK